MSTIGDKIDLLHSMREEKRCFEESIKLINEKVEALELELITQMDAQGIVASGGKTATVSITKSVKPSIDDWESFYKYIKKTGFFHLLERRPSVTGCRELLETKGKIPGVVPFTQRKLNLRNK